MILTMVDLNFQVEQDCKITKSTRSVIAAIPGNFLLFQLLGALLEWQSLSLVLAGHNAPFFIMLLFIPETPVYLLGKEQVGQAYSLKCL